MTEWPLFYGDGREPKSTQIEDFPPPPPWRQFQQFETMTRQHQQEIQKRWEKLQQLAESPENKRGQRKGATFRLSSTQETAKQVIQGVNAAIYLRRPLLITGNPGSGKTSLAYAIAYELQLGSVLTWPITARSTLEEAQYRYDAIGRLQDIEWQRKQQPATKLEKNLPQDIGQYITLGPVGTAFLPSQLPRVLLIDEIDKSDINLPNDLLNLFEEGWFRIPQLVRLAKNSSEPVRVQTADKGIDALVSEGQITCCAFPIVIMTSNGERDFPAAFLRRCLRVTMPDPLPETFKGIIESHFSEQTELTTYTEKINQLIGEFGQDKNRATDQLLNMIYLITHKQLPKEQEDSIKKLIFKSLSSQDSHE